MNKLITTLALVVLGITASAQMSVPLVSLTGDTSFSVMEGDIWKVDNITGDSTSTVSYMNWRGDASVFTSDTNETKFDAMTDWLIKGATTGIGYSINVMRIVSIQPANPATDSTSVMFYRGKNNEVVPITLDKGQGEINLIINAL